MPFELPIEERLKGKKSERNSSSHSSLPKHRWSSEMRATMLTAVAPTQAADVNSSLSEKMRKRRRNGENNKGYNIIEGVDIGGTSRKRRKLNTGRMPLQGCVTRRPTKGAWQTTKILRRREREEREERLLRAMSRKRSKPSSEKPKHIAYTPKSSVSPAISTPALKFGQTTTDTSTTSGVSKEQNDTSTSTSKPESTFQFGSNGFGALSHPKVEVAIDGAERKSEPADKSSGGFLFGNTSTTTINTSASQKKTEIPSTTNSKSAHQYHSKSISGDSNYQSNTKNQPSEELPPKVGITPSTSTASAAPFLGANASDSTQGQSTFCTVNQASTVTNTSSSRAEPKLSFGTTKKSITQTSSGAASVAPAVPSFGGNAPAAPITATIMGSTGPSFRAQSATVQASGGITAPTTNFGAPNTVQPTSTCAPPHQLGTQPTKLQNAHMSFGNTKENTNPGSFNSTFQASASSNNFVKLQATNGNLNLPLGMNGGFAPGIENSGAKPGFFGVSAGTAPGFSTGTVPVAATGASARRMARKNRNRRR